MFTKLLTNCTKVWFMSQLSQEEAELLSQENRFLKQTIFNLRGELEKLVNDQDSLIQTKIKLPNKIFGL